MLVEYQTDLSDNPKSYEKVRGIATANHKTLKKGGIEPGYEISTYDGESLNNFNSGSADFQTNGVTKDSKPNTYTVATPPITNEERTELKDSNINQRVIEKDGEKTYIHRLDPAYMRIAKTSLFPEDFAMRFLADQTKWNITGQEKIADINTIVIEGILHNGYDERYKAKTFKLNIDPNTGILLQMEARDASNVIKESIKTKTIEINKPVDTKLYNSIQK